MNTPTFLLAKNPIADRSDGRLFILHTRQPMLLAEVHHFELMSEEDRLNFQRKFTTGGRLDYPPETIFFTPAWVDESTLAGKPAQEAADKLAGLFRRMADWYKSYLIWEDSK